MTTAAAERELVAAAQTGDPAALDALLSQYQGRVLRFTTRLCGPEVAEDAAQETLLAAARTLPRFRGDASVSTWLYTIARSFCIKRKRRSKFAPKEEVALDAAPGHGLALADPSRRPDDQVADAELRRALEDALASLPRSQREVLVLRDVEGLSAREVAEVTGLSEEAVKSRLHRARVAVREVLAPALGRTPPPPAEGRCPDVVGLFSRKLEGEVPPDLCAKLEAHVAACPRCEALCASLRDLVRVCRTTPEPAVPARLRKALSRVLRERR